MEELAFMERIGDSKAGRVSFRDGYRSVTCQWRRQNQPLGCRSPGKSNCLESQWEWVRDLVAGWFPDEPYLSMELRIISSLRIQAVRASFFGFPADNKRWYKWLI